MRAPIRQQKHTRLVFSPFSFEITIARCVLKLLLTVYSELRLALVVRQVANCCSMRLKHFYWCCEVNLAFEKLL
jgi:hypothetical protein